MCFIFRTNLLPYSTHRIESTASTGEFETSCCCFFRSSRGCYLILSIIHISLSIFFCLCQSMLHIGLPHFPFVLLLTLYFLAANTTAVYLYNLIFVYEKKRILLLEDGEEKEKKRILLKYVLVEMDDLIVNKWRTYLFKYE